MYLVQKGEKNFAELILDEYMACDGRGVNKS